MEDGSKIGVIEKTDVITDGSIQIASDATAIIIAHNRVIVEKSPGGRPNVESIKTLARLVADAPDHVVKVLYPGKQEN